MVGASPFTDTTRSPTWFPHLPAATLAAVERLYAGGSYTQSRLVMHTLMHYKVRLRVRVRVRIRVRVRVWVRVRVRVRVWVRVRVLTLTLTLTLT